MKKFFKIQDARVIEEPVGMGEIAVYAEPGLDEKEELLSALKFDRHTLDSALDPDEISRLETGPDFLYIIWKRPNNVSIEHHLKFDVSSVGLVLQPHRLTFIMDRDAVPFEAKEFQPVANYHDLILKFLLHTIHHYLGHLKVIKKLTAELQVKLNISVENRFLLQLFALAVSLIYYLNAIEANASVLSKLRGNAEKIGFSKTEIEMLDDIIIEHQQCLRQTAIYSSVLSSLMDARGGIINNNMNVLLKDLTMINVVFLPLNLVASLGSMSEFSILTQSISPWLSYSALLMAMAALGWITWRLLHRKMGGRGLSS